MLVLLFIAACFLAYSNGANDNFKGVATLFGSGTTSYKSAITWATVTTFAGSVAAIFLAGVLVKNFSGKGLVPDTLLQGPEFAVSVALGAALAVFIASKAGMLISTTHSLVGALFGSGVVAIGTAFNFAKLGSTFLVPLVVSPMMAGVLSLLIYFAFNRLRTKMGFTKETCVCVGKAYVSVSVVSASGNSLQTVAILPPASLTIDSQQNCHQVYQGQFMGVGMQRLLDGVHFLSAGVVSFARGLNDTPKIAGLLLVVQALKLEWGISAIAVAIAHGGLLNAKKVALTTSTKITSMNHGQGFTANLITGLLVTTASIHGMPLSTTHVSVGAIFGIGSITGKANYRVVSNILLSWLLTLPVAAVCAGIIYWLINLV